VFESVWEKLTSALRVSTKRVNATKLQLSAWKPEMRQVRGMYNVLFSREVFLKIISLYLKKRFTKVVSSLTRIREDGQTSRQFWLKFEFFWQTAWHKKTAAIFWKYTISHPHITPHEKFFPMKMYDNSFIQNM
jgi:hypothetical protein